MILAGVVVLGLIMWRSGKDINEYEDRVVDLNSKEAKAALAVLRLLAKSTNHIETCLSLKANPMVRQKVFQHAVQLSRVKKMELKEAFWRQDYLSVAVACPTPSEPEAILHFYLVKNAQGGVQLVGTQ